MDPETEARINADAIEWHIRLRDGDDADWTAFERWLALDPAHAPAYHRVEDADIALGELLPQVRFREAANDTRSAGRRSWRWPILAGALAASIALIVALTPFLARDTYEVATSAGENQIVTLAGGTRITLNGSTRVVFDRRDPRYAELAVGEALFHVRHDADNPFRLKVGDKVVEDAGTVFNVVREGGTVRVSVSEGRVVYDPAGAGVTLEPGKELTEAAGDEAIRVADVANEAVGAWQKGRLSYRGEPLSQVAGDLARSLGKRIAVSPDIAARPFHGTIALDSPGDDRIERLALALNLRVEVEGDGWVLKPLDAGR